jgi:hypothetical protein
MTNQEKARKLESAAARLKSAASAYRHGRVATAHTALAGALHKAMSVAESEGWRIEWIEEESGDS